MLKNFIYYFIITLSVLILISADSTTGASTVKNKDIRVVSDAVTGASEKKEVQKDEVIELNDEKLNTRDRYRSKSMILFEDDYSPDYQSYEEEKKESIQNKPIDEKYNLIAPKTIEEFNKSYPVYSFDINNVIINGSPIIDKNLGERLFGIAYEMFSSNNLKNARMIFEKLVFYNYRIAESYNYISWCYFLYRDYDNAINYMKKAKFQGEKDNLDNKILSDYSYQIGRIYLILNDYNKAIVNFQEAIKYNNNSLKSYNSIGISYYKLGDTQKALDSWKTGMDTGDVICKKNYQWLLQQKK